MLHWRYIIESLAKINAGSLDVPDNLLVCERSRTAYARNLTFFPHKRKYSLYSDGQTAVYPSFLRTDGRRKSRRLSAGISIVMHENFLHYENLFPSLWKNISFIMEIFFRHYKNFRASLRSFLITIHV
jgi:hypothetical protein